MNTKQKFEHLKELDINAKTDTEHLEISKELEKLADNDPAGFETAVMESARQTLANAKSLKIREQLAQVISFVSMTYIASTYFKKSKSWLSQRINEADVNGKPATFLPEEIDTFNYAFQDLSNKLRAIRISC